MNVHNVTPGMKSITVNEKRIWEYGIKKFIKESRETSTRENYRCKHKGEI
jgi:hypothetical protein